MPASLPRQKATTAITQAAAIIGALVEQNTEDLIDWWRVMVNARECFDALVDAEIDIGSSLAEEGMLHRAETYAAAIFAIALEQIQPATGDYAGYHLPAGEAIAACEILWKQLHELTGAEV